MKILIVVAHPDDEVLGFGATGYRLTRAGELVQAVILCGEVDARTHRPTNEELVADTYRANELLGFLPPVLGSFPNIKMNTVPHLEIVQFIERQIAAFGPDRIFTHHPGDLNNDHLQVGLSCFAAARYFQRNSAVAALRSLHTMEIPSSTDWSFPGAGDSFSPNLFVEVGAEGLEAKITALACYRKVMRDFPHPRSREVLTGLAACRGAQSGMRYAEAFATLFQRGF